MTSLPGNPYAENLAAYDDPRNSLEAQATLALAYEQRTANLIAIYTDGSTGTAPGVNYVDVLVAIMERLGLAQEMVQH